MELSTAARKAHSPAEVVRILIESGDHSPRTAALIVDEAVAFAPGFAIYDPAAALWVHVAPVLTEYLGMTWDEQEFLEDLSADQITTCLACGGVWPIPEMTQEEADEASVLLEEAEERRINRAAGGMGCL